MLFLVLTSAPLALSVVVRIVARIATAASAARRRHSIVCTAEPAADLDRRGMGTRVALIVGVACCAAVIGLGWAGGRAWAGASDPIAEQRQRWSVWDRGFVALYGVPWGYSVFDRSSTAPDDAGKGADPTAREYGAPDRRSVFTIPFAGGGSARLVWFRRPALPTAEEQANLWVLRGMSPESVGPALWERSFTNERGLADPMVEQLSSGLVIGLHGTSVTAIDVADGRDTWRSDDQLSSNLVLRDDRVAYLTCNTAPDGAPDNWLIVRGLRWGSTAAAVRLDHPGLCRSSEGYPLVEVLIAAGDGLLFGTQTGGEALDEPRWIFGADPEAQRVLWWRKSEDRSVVPSPEGTSVSLATPGAAQAPLMLDAKSGRPLRR